MKVPAVFPSHHSQKEYWGIKYSLPCLSGTMFICKPVVCFAWQRNKVLCESQWPLRLQEPWLQEPPQLCRALLGQVGDPALGSAVTAEAVEMLLSVGSPAPPVQLSFLGASSGKSLPSEHNLTLNVWECSGAFLLTPASSWKYQGGCVTLNLWTWKITEQLFLT